MVEGNVYMDSSKDKEVSKMKQKYGLQAWIVMDLRVAWSFERKTFYMTTSMLYNFFLAQPFEKPATFSSPNNGRM